MNNDQMLLNRNENNKSGLTEHVAVNSELERYLVHDDVLEQQSYANGSMGMIRRDGAGSTAQQQVQEKEIKVEPDPEEQVQAPEKKILSAKANNANAGVNELQDANRKTKENLTKLVGQKQAAAASAVNGGKNSGSTVVGGQTQKPAQPQVQAGTQQAGSNQNKQPQKQPAQPVQPSQQTAQQNKTFLIHKANDVSIDGLCSEYITLFKNHFGLELSASICYENMRKMIEPDVKDPLKTLYFLENTYRVSTLLYLTGNLPIVFVTSILAEKNRKNILKYVTIEVENGAKPYEDLKALRLKRWQAKQANLNLNDAMTVTPGVTMLSNELYNAMKTQFSSVCNSLKKFNREMTGIVKKFDDTVLHDVTYIYSNWWYFLQGFENVQEMRTYVMAITDDTRKNLKI